MTAVFVDTGAFIALADRGDANHAAAKGCLQELARAGRPLATSTYVFDEAVTLLRMRRGHAAAVSFGERLGRTRWCQIVEIDEPLRVAAWQLFVRYHDQTFSFTDCTSFALMEAMRLRDAFAFDSDFVAAGFTVLPASRALGDRERRRKPRRR